MTLRRLLLTCLASLALVGVAFSQGRGPIDLPVEMDIPIAPTPFKADGKTHLVYELHLTNFAASELTLTRVEVLGRDQTSLAAYESSELNSRLARPGLPPNSERMRLGGGMRAILYVWLTLDSPAALPATLKHRVTGSLTPPAQASTARSDSTKPEPIEVKGEGAEVRVVTGAPLVISPPLRGGEWLAANGPGNASGHRRALVPIDGKAHIAQRFAIDWVQLRDDGKTWTGDQLKNESYRAYGAEALAVADGVVVATKDGIPQNIPGPTSRAVPITLDTVGGNHVIIDLGQGRYAFYAHLQPDSLRVKVGDKVRRGQVVGLVGNSGNSTEPHLHFHISNANSPLGSEGLPYVFESFEQHGQGWKAVDAKTPTVKRVMELPLQNAVVRFP
ncbi:MAG TPA: M23 family metallopeptidase [Blastocatellia bacterium]|nr:M23 family metallopeptidase [Blastocatellia bacterium]